MGKMCIVDFPEYLEKQFLKWQIVEGRRKTIEEFAEYLEVSRPILNMWMNGNRKPGKENLNLIARKLGNEVFDIAGLPRPNPYLQVITHIFEKLSPEHQRQLADDAERYETINENTRKNSKRRKTSSNH